MHGYGGIFKRKFMIDKFDGKYRFLSNFWKCVVEYNGIIFPSVEHAYQARKCICPVMWWFFLSITAGQAKRLGREIPCRSDWEAIKIGVMRDLIKRKFKNPELRWLLFETGTQELVEGNTWGDIFWGVCNGVGENWLGKILMEEREEIRKEYAKDMCHCQCHGDAQPNIMEFIPCCELINKKYIDENHNVDLDRVLILIRKYYEKQPG